MGYAPFPNEVTERIQRDGIPTIMGNHDDGVGFDRDECGCAYRDRHRIEPLLHHCGPKNAPFSGVRSFR